jgi:hypothetical protein
MKRPIVTVLEKCPTTDPAYAHIRRDFVLRRDGRVVGDVPCREPFSALSIRQLTDELITLQALRVAYYMDPGVPHHLPWTQLSLYRWMAANIGGVNLRTAPGNLGCCTIFDGRKHVEESIQSAEQRDYKREWPDIASTLAFLVHEVRHASGAALPTPPAALRRRIRAERRGATRATTWRI